MRTNILMSRIARLVETAGNAGDGAALAEEYAAAMSVSIDEEQGIKNEVECKVAQR